MPGARWALALVAVAWSAASAQYGGFGATCTPQTPRGATVLTGIAGYWTDLRRTTDSVVATRACEFVVHDNRNDTVVRVIRAAQLAIHAYDGFDVDGDGAPDSIIGVDSSGTGECCRHILLISANPGFHVVGELPWVPDFDGGQPGTAWRKVQFPGLAEGSGPPPHLLLAYQWHDGRMTEVTARFCLREPSGPFSAVWHQHLEGPPLYLYHLQQFRTTSAVNAEVDSARVVAPSFALQLFECKRPDDARKLMELLWSPADAAQRLERIRKAWTESLSTPR